MLCPSCLSIPLQSTLGPSASTYVGMVHNRLPTALNAFNVPHLVFELRVVVTLQTRHPLWPLRPPLPPRPLRHTLQTFALTSSPISTSSENSKSQVAAVNTLSVHITHCSPNRCSHARTSLPCSPDIFSSPPRPRKHQCGPARQTVIVHTALPRNPECELLDPSLTYFSPLIHSVFSCCLHVVECG